MLLQRLRTLFSQSGTRSKKMVINIAASFIVKGWMGLVQLLLVPLTLACLNEYEYGIWMTISAVLLWIDSFDVGLGNGLRNKLAEFVARGDWEQARQAVSTTFIALCCLVLPLAMLLLVVVQHIDLYALLNVDAQRVPHLSLVVQMALGLTCLTFVFKFIGNVYLGLQLPAVSNALVAAGHTLALAGMALAQWSGGLGFLGVGVLYTAAPLVVYLLAFPVTFMWLYPRLMPRLQSVRRGMLQQLFGMGVKFFVLQLAGIVLFATSNLILSRLCGPEAVSPYQVSFRYFSIATMLFGIVIAPIWSATTDACVRGDYPWIRKCLQRARMLLVGLALLIALMAFVAPYVYPVWTLGKVAVSPALTALMAIYTLVIMYSLLYAHIIYGFGTLTVATTVTAIEAVLFVPVAIVLTKTMGVHGIVLALILMNVLCAVTNRIQVHRLLNGTAKGWWKQ